MNGLQTQIESGLSEQKEADRVQLARAIERTRRDLASLERQYADVAGQAFDAGLDDTSLLTKEEIDGLLMEDEFTQVNPIEDAPPMLAISVKCVKCGREFEIASAHWEPCPHCHPPEDAERFDGLG